MWSLPRPQRVEGPPHIVKNIAKSFFFVCVCVFPKNIVLAFALPRHCDKYQNLMCRFKYRPRILLKRYVWTCLNQKDMLILRLVTWASTRENLSYGVREQSGADQPAHPRSLISAFVIRFLKSIICKLATGEISIF